MANANQPGQPKDQNTSQWFFNVNANTGLDQPPGSYSVFGAVLDAESQATLDALLSLPTSGHTGVYPIGPSDQATDVPVRSIAAINARGSLSPKDDLVPADRLARLMT